VHDCTATGFLPMSEFGDDLEYRKDIVARLEQALRDRLSIAESPQILVGGWLAVLHRKGKPDRSRTVRHQLSKDGAYRTPNQIERQHPAGRWQYHPEGVLLLRQWYDPVPEAGLLEGGFAEEAHFVRQTSDGRLVVFNDDASVIYVWERTDE